MQTALDWGTQEERAKRYKRAKGINTNQTLETVQRWDERLSKDEQLAREMGVHIEYDEVRQHNTNLWRT